jgi:nickel/cobalt transporter (NicO) family protein
MQVHGHDIAIQFAFFLGVLHALEPGHGKTALFAYMVGGTRKPWQPVMIGISTGVTHTLSILLIAIATHFLTHVLAAGRVDSGVIAQCLGWVSGLTILTVGVYMSWRAYANKPSAHVCGRDCGHHSKSLLRMTSEKSPKQDAKLGAVLGVGAGLIPCPTALAAYFASLAHGQTSSGFVTILIYGVGIALALTALGLLCLVGGRRIRAKWDVSPALTRKWALAQGMIILCVGLFYTWKAANIVI